VRLILWLSDHWILVPGLIALAFVAVVFFVPVKKQEKW